ncbi:serine/threonine-protein kinase [Mycolicibacterium hodleri]|uniref:non-specific serine/threonine protein kinase n=1 Tax=Mycolicibacterium hodleri TaxID=49897 RepID=A0A502E849_9MYCO|nr:serine/threonine-protein kinase [Mycolicibacterium hodleri]TPG33544.1 serine/threonine protein kinase [Mycolicibacterium hodleri]
MPLNHGDVFAGYVIQRLLGAGGMGEVYLAQHPRLPRLDALKVLSVDATGDQEFRARFTREAELAATLWNPHIVGVHDRGEFDGRLWISMDYVEGTDARHLVEQRFPSGMPVDDVVEIVTAVAEALDFAHERRLLHRDVKPANILVTTPPEGTRRRVLLTDFGIARETDDVSGITEANMAIGTVAYAAPEQLVSKSLDGRVDQYALAATAFYLLTGAPLFDNSNRAVVVGNHLHTPPPRLSERRPELAHLDSVLAKALAKSPDDRYPRCIDFAQAMSGQPNTADTPAHTEQRDSRPAPPDTAAFTAPFDVAADRSPGTPPSHTRRLELMNVVGTARAVRKIQAGADGDDELWSFTVERHTSAGEAHPIVPVELRGTSITGQLADGDVVEVNGYWDDRTLFADGVVNRSAGNRPRRAQKSVQVESGKTPSWRSRRALVVALIAVIAVLAASATIATRGFGLWEPSGPGPIVTPESATVFSPGGTPDHSEQAGLAIDGNPNTSWPTDTYRDAAPFPTFKQGVGLILHLSAPTALSEVTINVPSTGTEVQIRAADSATPASLSDTTELTPSTPLQPGENTITVDDQKKTSEVLVWITKLGTTDGQSRTEISDVALRAAR